jgi:hypothetical protein
MLHIRLRPIALAAASLMILTQPACSQASRTWVSGMGDDANPCSRTAPCKTFAGAISKTGSGGEISALDPAGYGAVTITKPITIDGGGGQVASVLVSGTNGIVIQAGANDTVILRNLRINGISQYGNNAGGIHGIRFLSGRALHVENCNIFGFTQMGIDINLLSSGGPTRVYVSDTTISTTGGGGIHARNGNVGAVTVSIFRTTLTQTGSFGVMADGNGGTGRIEITLSDSIVTGATTGVISSAGPADALLRVIRSSIVNNAGAGLLATAQQGKTGAVVVSGTLISGNAPGLLMQGGGAIFSFKDNNLNGNSPDGAFTGTIPLQ